MRKNILITGGTGFIGSNFINSYKDYYRCINMGRHENDLCSNIYWDLKEKIDYIIEEDIDTVIHSASIVGSSEADNSKYIDINVKSTIELLDYCVRNKVKKFIYISSGSVYGYNKEKVNESAICNPLDMYGMSKYFSEKLCDLYKNKISIIILRLFFPYGNGQKGRLFSNLVESVLQKKEINLNKDGLPVINPIHVTDVVNIIQKLIETDYTGVFNICGNELVSIESLCRRIAFHADIDELNFSYKENDVSNLIGDNKKICSVLGYKMNINLDEGIRMYLKSL